MTLASGNLILPKMSCLWQSSWNQSFLLLESMNIYAIETCFNSIHLLTIYLFKMYTGWVPSVGFIINDCCWVKWPPNSSVDLQIYPLRRNKIRLNESGEVLQALVHGKGHSPSLLQLKLYSYVSDWLVTYYFFTLQEEEAQFSSTLLRQEPNRLFKWVT